MKMVHFPTTRFSELAARAGGVTGTAAVEGALKNLESSRAESDSVIAKAIATIEAIVYAPHVNDCLTEEEMCAILRHADQIVTLAGTFCYDRLDMATRSLCDLTDGLLRAKLFYAAPVVVLVKAVRLMAPGGAEVSQEEADKVFAGLEKVLSHFQFSSLSSVPDCQNAEDTKLDAG
jgi:hypothetical protein